MVLGASSYPQTRRHVQFVNEASTGYHSHSHHDSTHAHHTHHSHNSDSSNESFTHNHREVTDGNHDHENHRHNVSTYCIVEFINNKLKNFHYKIKKNCFLAFVDDENSRDKIIFPDDNISRYSDHLTTTNSGPVPVCNNSTYCEDAPYYPEDAIRVALSERTNFRNVLTVDRVSGVCRVIRQINVY